VPYPHLKSLLNLAGLWRAEKKKMNAIELPHDWGATKRTQAAAHSGSAQDAAPPSPPVSKRGRPSSQTAVAPREPPPPPEAGPVVVVPSPLGPRSTFFNAITHDAPEKGQLKEMVMAQLRAGAQSQEQRPSLEVHCLLSKLPYQKMLSDLFMHQDKDEEVLPSPNIPYVTRTYEESFMREPLNSSERLCAKQDHCECMFLDREQPFIAVEFLLPGERPPPTPHLCVVCCRAVTQQLYYDIMFDKQDFGGVIQRFGNIHSQPGEYALDAMLIAAPNVALHIMPLPIVSHQRNRYSVVVKRGIKHLKQSRVHFQCTPSC
jgi:hypothetical protein